MNLFNLNDNIRDHLRIYIRHQIGNKSYAYTGKTTFSVVIVYFIKHAD